MKFLYASMVFAFVLAGAWIYALVWGKPPQFNHFAERVMVEMIWNDPESISYLGVIDNTLLDFHSGKLTDISYEKNAKDLKRLQNLRTTLHRYDRTQLGTQEKLTYDILDHFLSKYVACYPFGYGSYESLACTPYPVNQIFGIQNTLPDFFVNIHRIVNTKSAERYLSRLSGWSDKFQNLIKELKLREQNGVIPPRFIIEALLEESKGFIQVPYAKNMLFTNLREKLQTLHLSDSDIRRIEEKTLAAIETQVYPSYEQLIAFLEGQLKKATQDAGVWKFPNGDAYYAHCLKYHTTTDATPEEVHELGISEVKRIEEEMRQILDQLGLEDQTVQEAMRNLAQDPRFLYPDTEKGREEILRDFRAIFDRIQNKLPQLFTYLPKGALKIEAVPAYKAKAAPIAYYEPGDLKGKRAGVFYVNTHDIKNQPKFGMPTLAYHEGIPGHHFQFALVYELSNVPTFRKVVNFNAYAEGWALYCEKLASEYGFITSPYEELGRLQYELMRAVRLVVDSGIHYKR